MSNKIDNHNKMVTSTKYFNIDDAINSPIKSKTAFIIANERTKSCGGIGRYYTVFPTFKDFLLNRDKYIHCHELLVDHVNNKPNTAGRLVFDFDIKNIGDSSDTNNCVCIPKNFVRQIEDIVVEVIEQYFNGVDTNKFEFIWSQSKNPTKFSRHLTVKNLYFDNWVGMSKIFYDLFCIVWDEKHNWIKSSDLIDFQIARKRGSLRMVGSSKIGGYPLVFDNPKYKLTDSLIRIYFKSHREKEQLVNKNNINKGVFENVLYEDINESAEQYYTINTRSNKKDEPMFEKNIYEKAFELYNMINPNIFKMGKINGIYLSLTRKKPSKCLMSGKIHEQENAFLKIFKRESEYSVNFGCFRFCYKDKDIYIGSITINSLLIMVNPKYLAPKKLPRKSLDYTKYK